MDHALKFQPVYCWFQKMQIKNEISFLFITCEIDVWHIRAFEVLVTLCAVAHDHPAAVGPCVCSRGRRQDQLAVLVAVLDTGGGKQEIQTFTFTSTHSVANSYCVRPAPEAWVVEGVQVGRVRPSDGVAFTTQLHVPPRRQSCGLAQAHKAALI